MKVGNIYEVEPLIRMTINGIPDNWPRFLRLIGFSSKGHPVFQDGERFDCFDSKDCRITEINESNDEKPE